MSRTWCWRARLAGGGHSSELAGLFEDHLRKVINAGLHVLGLAPREPRGPQEPGPQTEAPAGASGV